MAAQVMVGYDGRRRELPILTILLLMYWGISTFLDADPQTSRYIDCDGLRPEIG